MTNPIGVSLIALILGFVIGMSIRGEYFNKKTYATVFGLGVFIDIFSGSFPFYEWNLSFQLPISVLFISAVIGLMIGKFLGGR